MYEQPQQYNNNKTIRKPLAETPWEITEPQGKVWKVFSKENSEFHVHHFILSTVTASGCKLDVCLVSWNYSGLLFVYNFSFTYLCSVALTLTYLKKSINANTKLFQRWHKQHKMVQCLFIWEQVLNTQDSPIKQERKKFFLWRMRSNLFCIYVVPVHVSYNLLLKRG